MNLAFLRYFLAVTETGSFTRAAERCNVTQPTLSAGIARLEEALGARLLERGPPASLTPAGRELQPDARAMLDAWQRARVASRAGLPRQRLRLALAATLPAGPVTQLLANVREQEGIELEIVEGRAAAMRERIARGLADVAITVLGPEAGASNVTTLFREPYLVAVAQAHPLATRDRCAIDELASIPFVVRPHCEVHALAARVFADRGVRPRVAFRAASDESAVCAARAGLGAVLLPRSLAAAGLALVALRDLSLERRVGLLSRRDAPTGIVDTIRRLAISHPWPRAAVRDERIVAAH
jgi:DNA-binding transcriptional LysR family regulator